MAFQSTQDLTNYSALLKEWYTPNRVNVLVLKESPLLAMLPKMPVGGRYHDVPTLIADTGGHGANFTQARTNSGSTTTTAFHVTLNRHYSLANIDAMLLLASEKDAGAFLPAARANIDSAFRALRRDLGIHLYRDGSGVRGQVASYADAGSTGTITLTNRYDVVNFNIGDVLEFAASKTSGSVDTGTFVITAIDTAGGTLTGAEAGGLTTVAASRFIYVQGDRNAVMTGLAGWLPSTAPTTGDSFFGVDRSKSTTALAGTRYDASGKTRYEALIDLMSEIATLGGGEPTKCFVHPSDFRQLVKEMEAKVYIPRKIESNIPVDREGTITVGFSGIAIQGDNGIVEVYADRYQTPNVAHMLTIDEIYVDFYGEMLADMYGRNEDRGMLLEPDADSYSVRCASYCQLQTGAPGHHGVAYNFGL